MTSENQPQDKGPASKTEAEVSSSDVIRERTAKLVAAQRAELQTAIDLATYVRFSYPIGIRITAAFGAALVAAGLVILVAFGLELPDDQSQYDLSALSAMDIVITSFIFLLGTSSLAYAGHSAQNYSESVNSWYERIHHTRILS